MKSSAIIDSPVGKLRASFVADKLARVEFLTTEQHDCYVHGTVAELFTEQLANYFVDASFIFTLPVLLNGTPLQVQVWEYLPVVQAGTVITYGQLAAKFATSPRVIGNICRCNPIPIIIPCHRVVAAHALGGYYGQKTGALMDIKNSLLQHERI